MIHYFSAARTLGNNYKCISHQLCSKTDVSFIFTNHVFCDFHFFVRLLAYCLFSGESSDI